MEIEKGGLTVLITIATTAAALQLRVEYFGPVSLDPAKRRDRVQPRPLYFAGPHFLFEETAVLQYVHSGHLSGHWDGCAHPCSC